MNIQSMNRVNDATESINCKGFSTPGITPKVKVLDTKITGRNKVLTVQVLGTSMISRGDYLHIGNKLYCINNIFVNYTETPNLTGGESGDLVVNTLMVPPERLQSKDINIVYKEFVVYGVSKYLVENGVIKSKDISKVPALLQETVTAISETIISDVLIGAAERGIEVLPAALPWIRDGVILAVIGRFVAGHWLKLKSGCAKYYGINKKECMVQKIMDMLDKLDQQSEQCNKFVDPKTRDKCFKSVEKEREKWLKLSLKYRKQTSLV
jgi:hypothetical protein